MVNHPTCMLGFWAANPSPKTEYSDLYVVVFLQLLQIVAQTIGLKKPSLKDDKTAHFNDPHSSTLHVRRLLNISRNSKIN
jgi:hypothetical protein